MFCAGNVMATTKDLASVVAQPQAGTLTYGASGSVTFDVNATLTGSGVNPNVTYSVTAGLPAGATASFSPNPVVGIAISTLTISSSTTVPGTFTLTIQGVDNNVPTTKTTTATLTVSPKALT